MQKNTDNTNGGKGEKPNDKDKPGDEKKHEKISKDLLADMS